MTAPHSLARWQNVLPFATSYFLVPLAWACAAYGGWSVLLIPIITWNTYTALDLALGVNLDNADPATGEGELFWYKLITWVWTPVQFVTLFGLIWYASRAAHLSGVAPAGTVQVEAFILYLQPFNDGGAAHIDNVSLIPAPASAALLGLGGLVATRRRRA